MKYGMRERVSGAVILLALGVIFIPMLFDDPPAREDRPEPVLTIEQPIDVEQTPVEAPERPASLGEIQSPQAPRQSPADDAQPDAGQASDTRPEANEAGQVASGPPPENRDSPAEPDAPRPDPIAELAQRAGQGGQQGESGAPASADDARTSAPAVAENGNWAVQVGSFGQPDNAARLEKQLDEQGFEAYSRPRDNNLTTVYVGPFASSDDGEQARTALKERANIQGLLIRVQEGE
ncbi:SPOR domain-containing protein [Modicisalibacter radicis]|uniref:SPOR domain-containing protein n=1 Tax=Halomonas sp. EAR18 TaxID=2518972 RepID=UPI00109CAD6F|nr:SPOR domain-containing protein [Halomonas sp. EAR18]